MWTKIIITILKCWFVITITNMILVLVTFGFGLTDATDFILKVNAVFWGFHFGSKFAKEMNKEQEKKDGDT